MIRLGDLNPKQRRAFNLWRGLGLSERLNHRQPGGAAGSVFREQSSLRESAARRAVRRG